MKHLNSKIIIINLIALWIIAYLLILANPVKLEAQTSTCQNLTGNAGIAGKFRVGQNLTATTGTLKDQEVVDFVESTIIEWYWISVNAETNAQGPLSAQGPSLRLTEAELGYYIQLRGIYTDPGNCEEHISAVQTKMPIGPAVVGDLINWSLVDGSQQEYGNITLSKIPQFGLWAVATLGVVVFLVFKSSMPPYGIVICATIFMTISSLVFDIHIMFTIITLFIGGAASWYVYGLRA